MDKNTAREVLESRQRILGSPLNIENEKKLGKKLADWGVENEKEATLFILEHQSHGKVSCYYRSVVIYHVDLSENHWGWEPDQETCETSVWNIDLVCVCGEHHKYIDENTPDAFRAFA